MQGNRVSPFAYVGRAAALAWQALQERRLPLSPRRWLLDLRNLRGVMASESPETRRARLATAAEAERERLRIVQDAESELRAFLDGHAPLAFAATASPLVSIVLVLHNRVELTLRCLRSIAACPSPLEVIIVDNASTDSTSALLERVHNARFIRHHANEGFSAGCNAGAAAATGRYLLFLNNDTELLPGSLEAAIRCAESSPDVGAVGAKLILPGGRLQEAGSIVWSDGGCVGYGRGESPDEPAYSFRRDVDFCSAAFMLTPRALFRELGGFDLAFSPAYYEDADYCVRLWERGRRVVYEPTCRVQHFEFASSPDRPLAMARQREKRQVFVRKHATWLAKQLKPNTGNLLTARSRAVAGQRILVFDDRVPHNAIGSGFPRAVALLEQLVALGHFVTVYPLTLPKEAWPSVYSDIPPTIEVITDAGPTQVVKFLAARRGYYNSIVVSRHHNMQRLRERIGPPAKWGARVVYDAEAVAAMRQIEQQRLAGGPLDEKQCGKLIREEVNLARGVDAILTVSPLEQERFAGLGVRKVVVARHAVEAHPTEAPFAGRTDLLFVGAFDVLSPNRDAVAWFGREVLPWIDKALGTAPAYTIAGHNIPAQLYTLGDHRTTVTTDPPDLRPLYERARLFVAPTRFAAGIPLKVIHAAANGVPVVCTTLLARQLGWQSGVDLLTGDTAEEFANACVALYSNEELWTRLRANALARVDREYSSVAFRQALREAFAS